MKRLLLTLRMIRFEHSVFALPFALAGGWLAAAGAPPRADLLLVVLAAVAARAAAMTFNRIVDWRFDALNPRTAARELPSRRLSLGFASAFAIAAAGIFVAAAFRLAPLCGWLALPVLALLLGYSFLKRFTWISHLGLGLALACAPAGAWLAVAKEFQPGWQLPVCIGAGVVAWVAGFDMLYALQDETHDRQRGLHSFPARFGARATLAAGSLLFLLALCAWSLAGLRAGLAWPFWAGSILVTALLAMMILMVRRGGVARVPAAFFHVNAWVGPVFFLGLVLGLPDTHPAPVPWLPR